MEIMMECNPFMDCFALHRIKAMHSDYLFFKGEIIMSRGRNFFGRGFWKAGYYGYPFPIGGGRGRGRGFCRAAIPYLAGNWAPPTCHTIHQRSHYLTGEDIIRRLMRAMVELRQLHRYPFKGSKHLKGFV